MKSILHILIFSFFALITFSTTVHAANNYSDDRNFLIQYKNNQKYGPFPVEAELHDRILFWIDIYSKYSSWEYVIHDSKYPQIVYTVLNTGEIINNPKYSHRKKRSEVSKAIRGIKKKYKDLLLKIHDNKDNLVEFRKKASSEEIRIIDALSFLKDEDKFKRATDRRRIRGQAGLKNNYIKGIYKSGKYLAAIKAVMVELGLPEELAYLPFLESGFNLFAQSRVGASGIWQFMPATGRRFIRVDEIVDERNDPLKAAEAAAFLLSKNFETLKSWPLAITAYNHGRLGMQKAVKQVGSDRLSDIIARYKGRTFGFASANFYTSFIAALHVSKNSFFFFGNVEKDFPIVYDEFILPEYIDINDFVRFMGLDLKSVKSLNPALTNKVYSGERRLPVGYSLRVPLTNSKDFLSRYKRIPSKYKFLSQKIQLKQVRKEIEKKQQKRFDNKKLNKIHELVAEK